QPGGSTTVTPTVGPADNGTVTLAVSSGTYTGTMSVSSVSGVVSLSNPAPTGAVHTITITGTDNCGATVVRTFQLTVGSLPTITALGPLARTQGSAGTASGIATVSDVETAAGSLVVSTTSVPAGLSVTGITNTTGNAT